MTRKEAIDWLKVIRSDIKTFGEISPYKKIEALDMAISSLETDEAYQLEYEQPEFCADCISRAEVLKLMKDNWHTHNGDWAMQESMDDIRALPSVYPKSDKPKEEPHLDEWAEHCHKVADKSVLEDIKAEIERWHRRRHLEVHDMKDVLTLFDNHIAGKDNQ